MAARTAVYRASRFATSIRPAVQAPRIQNRAQWVQRGRQFSVLGALRAKKYSEDHEWVELSEDKKTITLGISAYAASALGDVIYVELPQEGLEASAGESIGAVESVKSANDIMSPVAGSVVEINSELEGKPGLLNKEPEGAGWIAKLSVDEEGVKSLEGLMDEGGYRKFTEEAVEAGE